MLIKRFCIGIATLLISLSVYNTASSQNFPIGKVLEHLDSTIKANSADIAAFKQKSAIQDQRLMQLEADNARMSNTVKNFAAKIDALTARLDALENRDKNIP